MVYIVHKKSGNRIERSLTMARFIILIAAILSFTNSAQAIRFFDGNRKGFFLQESFGIGTSIIHLDYLGTSQTSKGAFNLEFKIGRGGSDQYQLYFINKLAIIDINKLGDDYGNYFDKMSHDDLAAVFYILASPIVLPFMPYASSHSILGIGGDYYFDKGVPSFFVGGGFGASFMYNPLNDNTYGGPGIFLSGGYEFQEHLLLKLDALYGFTVKQKHENAYYDPYPPSPEPQTRALSFLLTIGFHQY